MEPLTVASFLHCLRVDSRAVPVSAAEAFCLIAGGVDNLPDLQRAMELDPGATNRVVSFLRGRARMSGGKWIEGGPSLIEVRRHPHRRGMQLRLSRLGQDALARLSTPVPASVVPSLSTHTNGEPWQ
jgi:hypothetical protein